MKFFAKLFTMSRQRQPQRNRQVVLRCEQLECRTLLATGMTTTVLGTAGLTSSNGPGNALSGVNTATTNNGSQNGNQVATIGTLNSGTTSSNSGLTGTNNTFNNGSSNNNFGNTGNPQGFNQNGGFPFGSAGTAGNGTGSTSTSGLPTSSFSPFLNPFQSIGTQNGTQPQQSNTTNGTFANSQQQSTTNGTFGNSQQSTINGTFANSQQQSTTNGTTSNGNSQIPFGPNLPTSANSTSFGTNSNNGSNNGFSNNPSSSNGNTAFTNGAPNGATGTNQSTTPFLPVGASAGTAPLVQVFNSATNTAVGNFMAFDNRFTGGVRVAVGDVNGDGIPDVIVGAGPSGGPHIRVFDGASILAGTPTQLSGPVGNFFAFAPSFTGGVNIAAADVNNDGFVDIIVAADAGGGPNVRVFSGRDGTMLANFFAFAPNFTGGVRVAAGDLFGTGANNIVTGAGPGGAPQVRVFDGTGQQASGGLTNFFAFAPSFTGGVTVATGDISGTGRNSIITGAGPGGGPNIRIFDGTSGVMLDNFFAFDPTFTGGVRVGMSSLNGTGRSGLLVDAGPGSSPALPSPVPISTSAALSQLENFFAANETLTGSVAAQR